MRSQSKPAPTSLLALLVTIVPFVAVAMASNGERVRPVVAPSIRLTNFEAAFVSEHLYGDAQGDWLAEHFVRGTCPKTGDGLEILWGRADKVRDYVLSRGLASPGAPNAADYVELLRILDDAPICRNLTAAEAGEEG